MSFLPVVCLYSYVLYIIRTSQCELLTNVSNFHQVKNILKGEVPQRLAEISLLFITQERTGIRDCSLPLGSELMDSANEDLEAMKGQFDVKDCPSQQWVGTGQPVARHSH